MALVRADSGWSAEPLVMYTADVIGTHATVVYSGAAPCKMADELSRDAAPFLDVRFAWNKVRKPVAALSLTLHRTGLAMVDA